MSLKRLAVISAVGSHNSFNNQTISYISSYSGSSVDGQQQQHHQPGSNVGHHAGSGNLRTGGHHQGLQTMRPGANLHGNVNIMLGGAMLSVVITVVCFVCYCCHRNIKKRSNSIYRQQWLETEANMEIYSVEQCYDPPPSGASGFFMDGGSSSTGDYQSLPMVTSAINHTNGHHHAQYPYHHQYYHQQQQQQQQHHYQYTPYPNAPPPSYDTVVAQDELLANVSRRKRNHTDGSLPGPSVDGYSDPESPDCGSDKHTSSSSCTGYPGLLPKASAIRPAPRRYRRTQETSMDPAEEPLCGGVQLDEWTDDVFSAGRSTDDSAFRAETCCHCTTMMAGGTSSSPTRQIVPPIYCRNCGYFVEGSGDAPVGRTPSIDPPPSTALTLTLSTDRPRIERTRNETLLVDYEITPNGPIECEPTTVTTVNDINRNNVIDDGSNITMATAVAATIGDIDMLTMQMMAASIAPPSVTAGRMDTVNNNTAANETDPGFMGWTRCANNLASSGALSPDDDGGGSSSSLCGETTLHRSNATTTNCSENNNVITEPLPGSDTPLIRRLISCPMDHRDDTTGDDDDIIDHCPNVSTKMMPNQDGSLPTGTSRSEEASPTTAEDQTNGNGSNVQTVATSSGAEAGQQSASPHDAQRQLNENGLVRLDMSQIIDNTGLPTYEAALKLESSGYV